MSEERTIDEHEYNEDEKERLSEGYRKFREIRNRELRHKAAVMERIERKNKFFRMVMMLVIVPVFGIVGSLTSIYIENGKYIDKKLLQNDIGVIIENGGDLRAIKQAFSGHGSVKGVKTLFANKESYYDKSVALSTVLDDLRVRSFRENDKKILPKPDPLISEYEVTNPFDKLQVGQKDYFENIRIKTSSEYPKISNDLNNLADELFQQNQLVNEYLSDSKMSFWISVSALFLSLSIGGYQISTSRPHAMRKIFVDILGEPAEEKQNRSNHKMKADGK